MDKKLRFSCGGRKSQDYEEKQENVPDENRGIGWKIRYGLSQESKNCLVREYVLLYDPYKSVELLKALSAFLSANLLSITRQNVIAVYFIQIGIE